MKSFSKKQKQGIGVLALLLVSTLIMYTIIADSEVGANDVRDPTGTQITGTMNSSEGAGHKKAKTDKSKQGTGTTHSSGDTGKSADAPGDNYVYVTGAVENPGLYSIREHATVGDVVKACGGLLPYGAADALNMAEEVPAGTHIHVPFNFTGNPEELLRKQKLNINTASEKELDALPGIGPSTAKKIVEYRSQNGNFNAITDIKKVKGIGDGVFKKFADKITV